MDILAEFQWENQKVETYIPMFPIISHKYPAISNDDWALSWQSQQSGIRSYPHLIVSICIYHVQINLNKICLNQLAWAHGEDSNQPGHPSVFSLHSNK